MTKGTTDVYVSEELGSAFRWNPQFQVLEWAPTSQDESYNFETEGGIVEEEMVGEEIVTFGGEDSRLSEVFRLIEARLGVSR